MLKAHKNTCKAMLIELSLNKSRMSILERGRNTEQCALPQQTYQLFLDVLKAVFKEQASLHDFLTKPQKTACST